MAAIQNDRDLALQATVPRVNPVLIPIDKVDGLPGRLDGITGSLNGITGSLNGITGSLNGITGRLDGIDGDIEALGTEVNGVLNNTQDISIRVTNLTVTNSTSTVLTVVRKNGITGPVTWTIFAGNGTLQGSGDSRSIAGNTITGASVTVRASIGGKEAYATINKLGAISTQNTVNLATQVKGQLASGKVSGLGALAVLNTVDLNTQTTGALNGKTQVTNLGALAYANAIAADQIGAGTLAAGVIYAGTIDADKINAGSFSGKEFSGGTFTGGVFRTKTSGERIELGNSVDGYATSNLTLYDYSGGYNTVISTRGSLFRPPTGYVPDITGSVRVHYNNIYNGLELVQYGGSKSPLVFLYPSTTLPSPVNGGVFMHSTHGLCFSDGSKWLKTTWTEI